VMLSILRQRPEVKAITGIDIVAPMVSFCRQTIATSSRRPISSSWPTATSTTSATRTPRPHGRAIRFREPTRAALTAPMRSPCSRTSMSPTSSPC
jgi:hypothetical protein